MEQEEKFEQIRISLSSISSETPIGVFFLLDILSRSRSDFQEIFKGIFCETWQYKILLYFVKLGPLHKAEICHKLFPDSRDPHYKLSRGKASKAFDALVKKGYIVVIEDFGNKIIYDIPPEYKLVLRALFCGDVLALLAP